MRAVPLPDRLRRPRSLLFMLRGPQHGVRPGVELGRGPRDAVRVGGFRDLLGRPRSGGETAKAEGHVTGESVVDTPRDARGELLHGNGYRYGWEARRRWVSTGSFLLVKDLLRRPPPFFCSFRRFVIVAVSTFRRDAQSRHGRCAG